MKGDFSKDTFNAKKHFRDVLMQQGRVLLGSDWNEQAEITAHRIETTTEDIIGQSGAPMHDAGFQVLPAATPTNVTISAGRFYVDGILCENETDLLLFSEQLDFDKTALPTSPAGNYTFYLDVWLRHITALEDQNIREVALGGPDTTTRAKTIWQVKCVADNAANCASSLPTSITDPSTGTLIARAEIPTGSNNPCGLVTSGGYRRLENQLYRVEIHKAGTNRATSTFKWSRDNGSVLVKWESIDSNDPTKLIVSSTGRDELLGFKTGDWIELIDDSTDLLGLPGVLVQLKKVEENALFIDPTNEIPSGTPITLSTKNPRIRRWDSVGGEIRLNTNNTTWIPLEDGVEVTFKEGTFKTGDYWLIPARTATANIEWPLNTPLLPRGIKHHFAKLGILRLAAPPGAAPSWTLVSDCRPIFPPVTELTSLFYVSGDAQEAMPGIDLPKRLKVGVANGQWQVEKARIKFELIAPPGQPVAGSITYVDIDGVTQTGQSGITLTGLADPEKGIASCNWKLGGAGTPGSQQLKATLLDALDRPVHLPVIFTARLIVANNVKKGCTISVGEGGEFPTLLEAFRKLEPLINEKFEDICICLMPGNHLVDENIVVQNTKIRTIKISGCGAFIILEAPLIQLTAARITLQGFTLFTKNSSVKLIANEVNADHCRLVRSNDDKKTPFIELTPLSNSEKFNSLVQWYENRIVAEIALALNIGMAGWIENNMIEGSIYLNYADGLQPLKWKSGIKPDERKEIEDKLKDNLKLEHRDDELHICGNTVNNIVSMVKIPGSQGLPTLPDVLDSIKQGIPLNGYRNLFVSGNTLTGLPSSLIAELINMNNNQFVRTKKLTIVAFVIGQRGMVMENVDILDDNGGAVIDTLIRKKVIIPNLITVT